MILFLYFFIGEEENRFYVGKTGLWNATPCCSIGAWWLAVELIQSSLWFVYKRTQNDKHSVSIMSDNLYFYLKFSFSIFLFDFVREWCFRESNWVIWRLFLFNFIFSKRYDLIFHSEKKKLHIIFTSIWIWNVAKEECTYLPLSTPVVLNLGRP